MMDFIRKLSYKKYLGIAILALAGIGLIGELLKLTTYSNISVFYLIAYVAIVPIGVALLLNDEYLEWLVFSLGLFVIALVQFIIAFSAGGTRQYCMLLALLYIALGVIAIRKFVNVKIGLYVLVALFVLDILYRHFGYLSVQIDRSYSYTPSLSIFVLAPEHLLILFLYMRTFLKKSATVKPTSSTITLEKDVIDFKTLLLYLENEHNAGNLSDEDFALKRKAILDQI